MSDNLTNITDSNFKDRVLESELPVLVDFWAPWCGPCQAMAPVMDSLASVYAHRVEVAKCNVDASPKISTRYGIQSIPTVIVFKDGKPVKKIIGLVPAGQIETVLDQVLASVDSSASLMTV